MMAAAMRMTRSTLKPLTSSQPAFAKEGKGASTIEIEETLMFSPPCWC